MEEGKAAVSGLVDLLELLLIIKIICCFLILLFESHQVAASVTTVFDSRLGSHLELAWYCERRIVPKDMWDRAMT